MPLGLPHQGKAVVSGAGNVGMFLRYALNRYLNDRCLEYSASLTFTTLLAFVPMMVIALAILSQFPVFDDIRANLQTFILESFVPEAGVGDYVIVHAGYAIQRLEEDEAKETLEIFKAMGVTDGIGGDFL